jgi:hypothetical protein
MFIGLPAAGLAVSVLLPLLARQALDRGTALPVRPVFWAFGSIDRPWKLAVSGAVGLLAGLAIACTALRQAAVVTLTDDEISIATEDGDQQVPRGSVAAVFLDKKRLAVLDSGSRQLANETLEVPRRVVARAFENHGYPWQETDPYTDMYQKWSKETSELPPEVNTVLEARETALKKKATREARELRAVVEKLGFSVREDGPQQYWRPLVRS